MAYSPAGNSESGFKIASHDIVDAYKTYLFQKKTKSVAEIEAIKPGQAIPLDEIDHEIAVLKKTIETSAKFGLTATDPISKLKNLEKLRESIAGKQWPAPKVSHLVCKHSVVSHLKTPSGTTLSRCSTCSMTWANESVAVAAQGSIDPVDKPGKPGYYNKKFILDLKANSPKLVSSPKPHMNSSAVQLGRVSLEQMFLMRIGMLSNCNVTIQVTYPFRAVSSQVQLSCEKCKTNHEIEDTLELQGAKAVPAEIEKFCRAHRHDEQKAEAASEGRLFREDQ